MTTEQKIKKQIAENPILIYMKGTPQSPQCGFSARAVQCLKACGVEFASVNVLEDADIYDVLPDVSNWPTFPQVWVKGELIGGCDITVEMYESGELQPLLKKAVGSK